MFEKVWEFSFDEFLLLSQQFKQESVMEELKSQEDSIKKKHKKLLKN